MVWPALVGPPAVTIHFFSQSRQLAVSVEHLLPAFFLKKKPANPKIALGHGHCAPIVCITLQRASKSYNDGSPLHGVAGRRKLPGGGAAADVVVWTMILLLFCHYVVRRLSDLRALIHPSMDNGQQ